MTNRHEILPGGIAVIYLQGGGVEHATIIDAADLPKVAELNGCWYAQRRRWTWYAAITVRENGRRQTFRLHRFLMDPPDDMEVDHINNDGLDNRRSVNLRIVTPEENKGNCREWGRGGDIIDRWYERGCCGYASFLEELPFA